VNAAELLLEGQRRLAGVGVDTPRLDSELLLAAAWGNIGRERVYAHLFDPVPERVVRDYERLLQQRERRIPIAYLLRRKEFMSHNFIVEPGVFIPRAETETLVEYAVDWLRERGSSGQGGGGGPLVLDIGTGTGCIAVSVAVAVERCRVLASDISEKALEVARKNAKLHGVLHRVSFYLGKSLEPFSDLVPAGSVAAVLSNPPYLPDGDRALLTPEVGFHELPESVFGGSDGLDIVRAILDAAPAYLGDGGLLAVEVDPRNAGAALEHARRQAGLCELELLNDLSGRPRVLVAVKRSGAADGM